MFKKTNSKVLPLGTSLYRGRDLKSRKSIPAKITQRRINCIRAERSSGRVIRREDDPPRETECRLSRGLLNPSAVVAVEMARRRINSRCFRSLSSICLGRSATRLWISSCSRLSSSSRLRISSSSRLSLESSCSSGGFLVFRVGRIPRLPEEGDVAMLEKNQRKDITGAPLSADARSR